MKNLLLLPILFFSLISCEEKELNQAVPEEKIVELSIIEDGDTGIIHNNSSFGEELPAQIDPEANRVAIFP